MTNTSAAILLQARMGSERLPGKILSRIGDRTILGHCLTRLLASGVAPVVVVTTTNEEDAATAAEAAEYGVRVVRGRDRDVLHRYVRAAELLDLAYVIRATADNPAVDIDAPGRVLRAIRNEGVDYVIDRGLPHGAAVEAVRVESLRMAERLALAAFDREHVTSYIRRHSNCFRVREIDAPFAVRRPELRLTVDTPGDLAYMQQLYSRLEGATGPVPLQDIVRVAAALERPAEAA